MRKYTSLLLGLILCASATAVFGNTLAYWRFENGPAGSYVDEGFTVADVSGNGNHLTPSTGTSYEYSSETADSIVRAYARENNFSIKNSSSTPELSTRSDDHSYGEGSHPTGIDIETAALSQFTIEAIFKPAGSGYRTIIGRDGRYLGDTDTSQTKQAALYLQLNPDNGIGVIFNDVSGVRHTAVSENNMITCYDTEEDPLGENGRWYYVAAASDGSALKVYLANLTAGTDALNIAEVDLDSDDPTMAIGSTSGTDWHAGGWSIGRGLYEGVKTDYFPGYVDEVRISDTAINESSFLIYPKGTTDANPLFNGADPAILMENGIAYIYPTSGYYRHTFVYTSTDLVNWTQHGPILNFDEIEWMPDGKNCWAPGIFKKNDKYYLYYSAGPKPSYIGVAVADSPVGPFTDSGAALIADNGDSSFEAIDPMAFEDPKTGKVYLFFGGSAGSKLKMYELNSDLISLKSEISVPTPENFTEGAFMHYRNGFYYITYSHGSYNNSSYSLHYSASKSITGPWTYLGPILESDTWFKGPGHHSLFYNGATDEWYVCYHRWNERFDSGSYSGSRSVCIDKLYYSGNRILPIVQTDYGVGPVKLSDYLTGDINTDGVVDFKDFAELSKHWQYTPIK